MKVTHPSRFQPPYSSTRPITVGLMIIVSALICLGSAKSIRAETWSDTTGKFKVEAKFISIQGDEVVLTKADGLTIKVPLAKLDKASQDQAKRLATSSPKPAATALAPATSAPAASTAPSAAQGPEAYLRELIMASDSQDYQKVWNALPTNYQTDIHDVIHSFAENMDAKLWNQGADVLKKAVRVLKEKREFILGHPAAALAGPALSKSLIPITEVLDVTVNSELSDLQKLKTFDVVKFATSEGKIIAEKMKAAAEAGKEIQKLAHAQPGAGIGGPAGGPNPFAEIGNVKPSDVKVVVVKQTGDTAVIRFDVKDKPGKEDEWIKVSGKWLPKKMVDDWQSEISKAKAWTTVAMKQGLEKSKVQFGFFVTIINQTLDKLLAAQSQEDFNAVINEVQQQFAGLAGAPPGK